MADLIEEFNMTITNQTTTTAMTELLLHNTSNETATTAMTELLNYNTSDITDEAKATPSIIKTCLIIIGSIGLLGNGIVIYVIARSKKMRKQLTNLFVMNQSCIDFVGSFFLIVFQLNYRLESESLISHLVCILVASGWPLWSAVLTSTFNLVTITIERYLMICYPIIHRNWSTHKRALTVLICLWIAGPMTCIAAPTTSRLVENECKRFWPHPAIEAANWLLLALIMNVGPPFFFIIAYTKIFLVIRRRLKMKKRGILHLNDPNKKWVLNKIEKNILKTMALVCTCYFVCYLPNLLRLVLGSMGVIDMNSNSILDGLPSVFLLCNFCINPFIYIFQFEVFQQEFKQYVCVGRWNRVSPSDPTKTQEMVRTEI